MKGEFFAVYHDCVSRIVPAVEFYDVINFCSELICCFSFTFIAPLCAHDNYCRHTIHALCIKLSVCGKFLCFCYSVKRTQPPCLCGPHVTPYFVSVL